MLAALLFDVLPPGTFEEVILKDPSPPPVVVEEVNSEPACAFGEVMSPELTTAKDPLSLAPPLCILLAIEGLAAREPPRRSAEVGLVSATGSFLAVSQN